jgi:hypothetical protein
MRRSILRYKKKPGIKHWIMVFVWQFPSMTMAYAWCTYMAGLTLYFCSPFIKRLPWQDRHKVTSPESHLIQLAKFTQIAIAYLAWGLVGLTTYISATIFVYAGEKDYERSVSSSRARTLTNTRTTMLIDRTAEPSTAGPRSAVDKAMTQPEPERDTTSSTIVDEASPVQITREKVLVGFQHSEPPKRNPEKTRRLLLY